MFSIWDLFVQQIAGGFFISLILIMLIFAIILAIGGVSFFSTLLFSAVFSFSMFIGYGLTELTFLCGFFILAYFGLEVLQFMQRGGG